MIASLAEAGQMLGFDLVDREIGCAADREREGAVLRIDRCRDEIIRRREA